MEKVKSTKFDVSVANNMVLKSLNTEEYDSTWYNLDLCSARILVSKGHYGAVWATSSKYDLSWAITR